MTLTWLFEVLELFGIGYSWGGFESLAVYTDPVELGTRRYFKLEKNEHLVRLHIGLEDPKDLILLLITIPSKPEAPE